MVGSAGFEPAASSAQGWHHTKLDNDPPSRQNLSLSECNFNLMNKIDVLPFIYPTIGLWHKQAKLVLLFFQQFES
jgi:hypothetical protein